MSNLTAPAAPSYRTSRESAGLIRAVVVAEQALDALHLMIEAAEDAETGNATLGASLRTARMHASCEHVNALRTLGQDAESNPASDPNRVARFLPMGAAEIVGYQKVGLVLLPHAWPGRPRLGHACIASPLGEAAASSGSLTGAAFACAYARIPRSAALAVAQYVSCPICVGDRTIVTIVHIFDTVTIERVDGHHRPVEYV